MTRDIFPPCSNSRRAARRWAFALIVCTLITSVGHAVPTPTIPVDPWVPRAVYQRLVERLGLDADRRVVAEVLYDDYAAESVAVARGVARRAETAGRSRLQDALAGRSLIPADELRPMRVAVENAERPAWPEADRLLAEIRFNTASLMMSGESGVEEAFRSFDRVVYGAPRRRDRGEPWYAGEGVDVLELLAAARGADELAGLNLHGWEMRLAAYERDLVRFLAATAAADRSARLDRRIAEIEHDQDRLAEIERSAVLRWRHLDALNGTLVGEIGEAAQIQLGEDARDAWRERYDRACFPSLFVPPISGREADWIIRHGHDAEVRARVDAIRSDDTLERERLRRDAIRVHREARSRGVVTLHAGTDPGRLHDAESRAAYRALLKISGASAQLDVTTSAALHALLTERQRKQMRADLAAASAQRQ